MDNKGFTLIELLVVISIIGVISSIVFVSFSGSRSKAKLAKAQNFDAQISHALGAYAVGIWRFEESAGTTAHDESGYGNDGTFVGNPSPTFPDSEVYPGTKALQFDGTDDYVDITSSPSLNITNAITIEAWVKPDIFGHSNYHIVVESKSNYGWFFGTVSGKVAWLIGKEVGSSWNIVHNKGDLVDGWNHIVGIYESSTGVAKTYLNGNYIGSKSGTAEACKSTNGFKIGRQGVNSYCFKGAIDNVRIYDQALSSAQIQQHYAAGAPAHGIAVK